MYSQFVFVSMGAAGAVAPTIFEREGVSTHSFWSVFFKNSLTFMRKDMETTCNTGIPWQKLKLSNKFEIPNDGPGIHE